MHGLSDCRSFNTSTAAECCAACTNTSLCTYFTFVHSRQLCWVKADGTGGTSDDKDCTSGSALRRAAQQPLLPEPNPPSVLPPVMHLPLRVIVCGTVRGGGETSATAWRWSASDSHSVQSPRSSRLSGSLPPRPPQPCTSDTDCNHAGTCADGKCTCDAPFYGNSCEKFTLYSYKPGEGGLEIPTGNTTWGGSVVEADGNYPFLLCPPPLLAESSRSTHEVALFRGVVREWLTA
jgi:hypothetical protein